MEQRMIDLEIKVAYQENTIEQLNQVVIDQQNELDRLTREVNKLRAMYIGLAEQQGQTHSVEDEPPPPHY